MKIPVRTQRRFNVHASISMTFYGRCIDVLGYEHLTPYILRLEDLRLQLCMCKKIEACSAPVSQQSPINISFSSSLLYKIFHFSLIIHVSFSLLFFVILEAITV